MIKLFILQKTAKFLLFFNFFVLTKYLLRVILVSPKGENMAYIIDKNKINTRTVNEKLPDASINFEVYQEYAFRQFFGRDINYDSFEDRGYLTAIHYIFDIKLNNENVRMLPYADAKKFINNSDFKIVANNIKYLKQRSFMVSDYLSDLYDEANRPRTSKNVVIDDNFKQCVELLNDTINNSAKKNKKYKTDILRMVANMYYVQDASKNNEQLVKELYLTYLPIDYRFYDIIKETCNELTFKFNDLQNGNNLTK